VLLKTLRQAIASIDADIFCLQETKIDIASTSNLNIPYEFCEFNCAIRRGYSGTAIFSKIKPTTVNSQTEQDMLLNPTEGRVIVADFGKFYLINVYTPNAQSTLARLSLRKDLWDPQFLIMLIELDKQKPIIACGDFNVAHQPIDLARPAANRGCAGFTNEERAGFSAYTNAGFIDAFRNMHPGLSGMYSWWSYRAGARKRNIGWRIDYFIVSARLMPSVSKCEILANVYGSDHAPVFIDIED
jgi:exodeoxyribonuclease-3